MARAATQESMSIVQILRTVERGREHDSVLLAEVQDLVGEQSQIRCNDELQVFASGRVELDSPFNDVPHQGEIQERLAPLKLDLDGSRRRAECEVERQIGILDGHVVPTIILRAP
ncbi:MAG: hypothetical protein QM784_22430 [Polyangiaceae bacterium]